MAVLLERNKQSLNQVAETLNSFPKQNQKLLIRYQNSSTKGKVDLHFLI